MYTYKYPRPALTTDALIFGLDTTENIVKILLIKRLNEPFKDKWALPGGFVDMDETAEQGVIRELEEETHLKGINFEQFTTASTPDRDPRGRSVSVIFWAVAKIDNTAKAGDDAKEVKWHNISNLPQLAFDHSEIVNSAIKTLKTRLKNKECFKDFFTKNLTSSDVNFLEKIL